MSPMWRDNKRISDIAHRVGGRKGRTQEEENGEPIFQRPFWDFFFRVKFFFGCVLILRAILFFVPSFVSLQQQIPKKVQRRTLSRVRFTKSDIFIFLKSKILTPIFAHTHIHNRHAVKMTPQPCENDKYYSGWIGVKIDETKMDMHLIMLKSRWTKKLI